MRKKIKEKRPVEHAHYLDIPLSEDHQVYCACCGASAVHVEMKNVRWKKDARLLSYDLKCSWCGGITKRVRIVGMNKVRILLVEHPRDQEIVRLLRFGEFT